MDLIVKFLTVIAWIGTVGGGLCVKDVEKNKY